ncbi:lytic murein transglycosylase [Salinisphaera orenii]|uniref:Murein transglycosylase n=1 Tax=Salinisphaera orenii YIM 95161 TaxID=1051139 RepID=A0A423PNT1_9GAMM|nr:lytic murein transglycosylase [Salinisphaera halophila]ROO27218.1 murein transglycosylase [Salinisphaera halophila YIM 95161]
MSYRISLTLSALALLLGACAHPDVRGAPAADAESASAKTGDAASPEAADEAASEPAERKTPPRDAAGFERWVAGFRERAAARGVDRDTLAEAFDDATFQPSIIELDRRQPEFTRAIWTYLDSAVSATRVARGREELAGHAETARTVEARYGVSRTIIGAIWGVESNFGGNFGGYEVIDALATLAYDGRRRDFAKEQLYAALAILADGDIERERMQGSWAGAMGHTQFIPTSFRRYAVDADGDGRRDIWGSIADVMGSTAHYLAENGWQRDRTWGREVVLPPDFDYAQAEIDTRRTTAAWRSAGVRAVDDRGLPQFEAGSILAPAGAHGPAFLVGPNFRVILRYNNATSYGLAVGLLSDRLAGDPGVQGEWPRTLASLSRDEVREMQRLLNELGHEVGAPDGLVGPNTRAGLRGFQREQGRTADGYPTHALLRAIRAAAR